MNSSSKENTLATYKQIELSLRGKICDGSWPAGMMLPSRRELAKEYSVSPITIERAITPLISEGMLRADDRRGTFVTEISRIPETLERSASQEISHSDNYSHIPGTALSQAHEVIPTTIGIVATLYVFHHNHLELNNLWVRHILQTMELQLSESGHATRFYNRVQSQDKPLLSLNNILRQALEEGVDALALIAFGMVPEEVDEELSALEDVNIPVVCVTAGEIRRPIPHVFMDNRSAGYDAATCLLRSGVRDILFFSPFVVPWVQERIDGARSAVLHSRLPEETIRLSLDPTHRWIQEEDPQQLSYLAAKSFLDREQLPAGVITCSDGVAFGFLQAAAERGLTPGEDFSLVSFDDHPDAIARHLTSLRPPMEAMGAEAARVLLRSLQGQPTSLQMRMRWTLVTRASCRPHMMTVPTNSRKGKESARP